MDDNNELSSVDDISLIDKSTGNIITTSWSSDVSLSPVESIRQSACELQIGNVLRNPSKYGLKKLADKARSAQIIVDEQSKKRIFPYGRYLKYGHHTKSEIIDQYNHDRKDCIIWCNNHYLGLNYNSNIIYKTKQGIDKYGLGCGTSAVSGGFNQLHIDLQKTLAKIVRKSDAILFPTGFTANLGGIGTLASKGDLVLVDKECHASIIDGIKLSQADLKVFRHNDPMNLEKILKEEATKQFNNVFVVSESVFSMSGEEAPLAEYCKLKKTHKFYLYIDEAHAFGFYDKSGGGLVSKLGLSKEVDFIMSTLSKSTTSIGGFIASDNEFITYLRYNSNPYLFQASMTPADTSTVIAALEVITNGNNQLVDTLWKNTHYFRSKLKELGYNVGESKSPIVPIYIDDDMLLAQFCLELYDNGVFTNWISYPAVKKGKGRLRFIVNAEHTKDQIDYTVKILSKVGTKLGIIELAYVF